MLVTAFPAAGLIIGFIGAVLIFTLWTTAAELTSAGGPGMPGRLDQLRGQLHLHGQVPGPPGHRCSRVVGLPARGRIGHARHSPGRHSREHPACHGGQRRSGRGAGVIGTGFAYVFKSGVAFGVAAGALIAAIQEFVKSATESERQARREMIRRPAPGAGHS